MSFRVLPEFILEDVIDYFLFIVRYGTYSYLAWVISHVIFLGIRLPL